MFALGEGWEMTMGTVSVLWVAMVFMQAGDPTYVDPDTPRNQAGPVHRKAEEPVARPAPSESKPAQRETPKEEPASFELPPTAPAAVVPGTVRVRSEMGKRYRLVEATVAMDGAQVAQRRAPEGSELEKEFTAYKGSVSPGRHALNVTLVYQGRNAGLFNYVDDYTFRVQSSYAFEAFANRPAVLDVVAKERKGISVPLEQKPMIVIAPAPGSGATSVSVETNGNAQGQ
jgi:hypothetical protein